MATPAKIYNENAQNESSKSDKKANNHNYILKCL